MGKFTKPLNPAEKAFDKDRQGRVQKPMNEDGKLPKNVEGMKGPKDDLPSQAQGMENKAEKLPGIYEKPIGTDETWDRKRDAKFMSESRKGSK